MDEGMSHDFSDGEQGKYAARCGGRHPTVREAAAHARWSVHRGWRRSSRLTDEVLAIEGMSSPRVKCLLNNLCSAPWASYLEVGCWRGSTLCAAAYGNSPGAVVGIDNYSEAPEGEGRDARAELHRNCARLLTGRGVPSRLIAEDFRSVDPFTIGPFTVYFYDGAHDADAQREAFTHMGPALADVFVAVVDDWNMRRTRLSTREAFAELGWGRIWETELPANRNGDLRRWWNGLLVSVIDKRQADIRLMLAARGMGPDAVDRWMAAPIERLDGSSLADAVADGRTELALQTARDLLSGRGGVRPPRGHA